MLDLQHQHKNGGGGGGGKHLVVAVDDDDHNLEEQRVTLMVGSYNSPVQVIEDASEEILLLWSLQQPTRFTQNAYVHQSSIALKIESCGHNLVLHQSPSSMNMAGVTGGVIWDSGVVLGKFLEHAVELGRLYLQGKKGVELGSGCGLVGCIAALLGVHVILTDLPDRLKLLRKNLEVNLSQGQLRGSASVAELTWGDDIDADMINPFPDFVFASDVIYNEGAVMDLLDTLRHLSGGDTTIFVSGELRNDAVLEFFLEAAMKDFVIGHVDQAEWHPDYQSPRVVIFVMLKK